MIVLGEGDGDVLLLADAHADDLFLEAGDEGAGAENKAVIGVCAAVEGNAVHGAGIINDGGIAVLGGALGGGNTGVAALNLLQLVLHRFIGDLDLAAGRFDALVLAELDLRPNSGHEGQRKLLFLRDIHSRHGRTADRAQLGFLRAEGERIGSELLSRVVVENVLAVVALDDHAGRFPLAEALNKNVLFVLQVNGVDGLFKRPGVDHDVERYGAVLFVFQVFYDHVVFLLPIVRGNNLLNNLFTVKNIIANPTGSCKA